MSDESSSQSGVQIATIVVMNIIYWMVMITAIGLGAIHLRSCPVQPNIPIYLIVLGSSSIIFLTLAYFKLARGQDLADFLTGCSGLYIYTFSFCWFIIGTRWIYAVYPPSYTPGTDDYCHKTLYQFSFVLTSLQWTAVTSVLICAIIFFIWACCTTRRTRHHLFTRSSFYGTLRDSRASIVDDFS